MLAIKLIAIANCHLFHAYVSAWRVSCRGVIFLTSPFTATCLPLGVSQAPVNKHPPLVTTCQVMQQVLMDVQTALNSTGTSVSCTLSTNCTQIQCQRPLHRNPMFMLEIQACRDPVTVRIVHYNDTLGTIIYESVIENSQMIGVDLGYGFMTLSFTLAQRRTRLSLGLKVWQNCSHQAYGVNH